MEVHPEICTNEPVARKRYTLACGPIKDSDQPVQMRSLVSVFDGHSMGSQRSQSSEAQTRNPLISS